MARLCVSNNHDCNVLQSVLVAMRNLTKTPENRVPVVRCSGVVRALVRHVGSATIAVVRGASATLRNLSWDETCRADLTQSGVVAAVCLICTSSKDSRILANATAILANLALDDSCRSSMVGDGVIRAVLTATKCKSADQNVVHFAVQAVAIRFYLNLTLLP